MQTKKRWASVALLAAGIAIGVVMVATPAGAHVGGSVNHLWNHLKPKADNRYVNNNELLWALVESDGTLVRDNRAVSAQSFGSGGYEVIFNRNVRNCAYVATIGTPDFNAQPAPGEIGITGRQTNVNGVFVVTRDSAGAGTNRAFFVAVACNEAAPAALARVLDGVGEQPE